jgi:hypothetical protein
MVLWVEIKECEWRVACDIHHWKQTSIPRASRVPKQHALVCSTYQPEVEVKDVTGTVNLAHHKIIFPNKCRCYQWTLEQAKLGGFPVPVTHLGHHRGYNEYSHYLSIYLSVYLSIYLSICLSVWLCNFFAGPWPLFQFLNPIHSK